MMKGAGHTSKVDIYQCEYKGTGDMICVDNVAKSKLKGNVVYRDDISPEFLFVQAIRLVRRMKLPDAEPV